MAKTSSYQRLDKKPFAIKGLFAVFALITPAHSSFATDNNQGESKPSLYQRIPDHIRKENADFYSLTIENDMFGSGQDRNYTNGMRISRLKYGADIPDFFKILERFIPTFSLNETSSITYSIGQNMYTPSNITKRTPPTGDRPYAGFLYGSAGITSLSDNHVDDLELSLGVIGPWSLAKQAQKFVHKVIDYRDPKGWSHQLHNEPGLVLSWQRLWPTAYEHEIYGLNSRFIPHSGVTLGNVYTHSAAGIMWQITPKDTPWQSLPQRVRPAIPGNGFFMIPEDQFSWSLFAGAEGRLVGRNIFLDGNSFRDSPSVDKKYTVLDLNAGLTTSYGRAQIAYTLNWRSKEFHGQDDPSLFGSISLAYRF